MSFFSNIGPNKNISNTNSSVSVKVESASLPVVEEPVIVRQSTKRIPVRGAISTPSILDALKDEEESTASPSVSEDDQSKYIKKEANKSFLQAQLLEAWKDFVSTIDAPQLKSALGTREPELINQWQIEYVLDTELQYNRLTLDLKPKLLGFLRRRFENESIEILFKVSDQTINKSEVPYTDEERWNLLVTRYPSLSGLKSKFGLDFEHY